MLTIVVVLIPIWLYSSKSGNQNHRLDGCPQSLFPDYRDCDSIITIKQSLGLSFQGLFTAITGHPNARLFDWDLQSGTNFFKQFISGLLITVALGGLDQSMMQKTLTIPRMASAGRMSSRSSFYRRGADPLPPARNSDLFIAEKKRIALREHGRFTNTDGVYPLLTLNYFGRIRRLPFW